ncbi:MAG TPA: cation diffusion facilitator family transporter [Elusimicrobiota bacterium]|nr:cation diffusion facilitator family transporter [Elusimicrobiota bacterium]
MHTHAHTEHLQRPRSQLTLALGITAFTFLVELAGGWWANSVALLSDAGHVFMDASALSFSLLALHLSGRPATDRRTFGLHRLEVFAAFLNGALVMVVAGWIVVESIGRLRVPEPVKTGPMLGMALWGLAANLFVAWRLHSFAKNDLNMRGAFLHVLGDALASVGVVAGGIALRLTGLWAIDPLVGIIVALIVLFNAVRLLKDSLDILLEGVPRHLVLDEVVDTIRKVPGVASVDDTHIWNICSHICSLSAHITVHAEKMPEQQKVVEHIGRILHERFHINHSTIQTSSTAWKHGPTHPTR